MLTEIERGDSLAESVLQRITEAIITGEITSDDKLVEAHVAEQLGVSRGPVREAFRRLEQMGVVEKVHHRGTFVSALNKQTIEDLYRVRASLEALAARILAERNNPKDVNRLREKLRQMEMAIDSGRTAQLFKEDAAFHDTLIELSQNGLLNEIWSPVSIQMRRVLLIKRERPYESLAEVVEVHRPIVEAIAAGDADRAEAAAKKHVSVSAKHFWDTYRPE